MEKKTMQKILYWNTVLPAAVDNSVEHLSSTEKSQWKISLHKIKRGKQLKIYRLEKRMVLKSVSFLVIHLGKRVHVAIFLSLLCMHLPLSKNNGLLLAGGPVWSFIIYYAAKHWTHLFKCRAINVEMQGPQYIIQAKVDQCFHSGVLVTT